MLAENWDSNFEAAAQTTTHTADIDWTVVGFGQQQPASVAEGNRSVRYRRAVVGSPHCARFI